MEMERKPVWLLGPILRSPVAAHPAFVIAGVDLYGPCVRGGNLCCVRPWLAECQWAGAIPSETGSERQEANIADQGLYIFLPQNAAPGGHVPTAPVQNGRRKFGVVQRIGLDGVGQIHR